MTRKILEVRNISFEYTTKQGLFKKFRHKVFDNLSFCVEEGEVVGIIGGNGSGKSTLLKILSGVLEPDSGEIVVPDNITRSLLSLGLGFNNELTGRDNVILSTMFNGYSKKEAIELSEDIGEYSELGEFFDQPVRTYSSGMRSRLGFSAGIITEVDILMIDEVLSVGDKAFRIKAEKTMMEKIFSNQTVLFVSHSEKQINRICDRCIDLNRGGKTTSTINVLNKKSLSMPLPQKLVRAIVMSEYDKIPSLVRDDFRMLRDVAVILEEKNPALSLELMKKAHTLNPDGAYISNKLKDYISMENSR